MNTVLHNVRSSSENWLLPLRSTLFLPTSLAALSRPEILNHCRKYILFFSVFHPNFPSPLLFFPPSSSTYIPPPTPRSISHSSALWFFLFSVSLRFSFFRFRRSISNSMKLSCIHIAHSEQPKVSRQWRYNFVIASADKRSLYPKLTHPQTHLRRHVCSLFRSLSLSRTAIVLSNLEITVAEREKKSKRLEYDDDEEKRKKALFTYTLGVSEDFCCCKIQTRPQRSRF